VIEIEWGRGHFAALGHPDPTLANQRMTITIRSTPNPGSTSSSQQCNKAKCHSTADLPRTLA
jgi:hypothetical protein